MVLALALAAVFYAPRHSAQPSPSRRLGSAVLVDARVPNTSAALAQGRTLYDESCSSCHGTQAQGSSLAPNLRGLGSATVDLWVSSGWMPLANPGVQPARKPSHFTPSQTSAIARYVASLVPGGLAIPTVDLKGASSAEGFSVFALNCAPCHTITGAGDALSNGIVAPPLHGVTGTQIEEAVRTGPGNMPRFSTFTVSKQQLADVVDYVTRYVEHPDSPGGGLTLGGVGPVAEGFVGLFAGVGLCVLIALWIGDRNESGGESEPGHGDGGHGDGGHDEGPRAETPEREVAHA